MAQVIALVLYNAAFLILGPFYLLGRRLKRRPCAPLADRLWRFPKLRGDAPVIWIHGVSVGEILAARGLVVRLRREWPEYQVVLSTTTLTGQAVAQKEYPECTVFFCPFDLYWSVKRALHCIRPEMVILMELELWPQLLALLDQRAVPVILANGRLSLRSAKGYQHLLRVFPSLLHPIRHFLMQNDDHARRVADLGVSSERIEVLGNLKVDNLHEEAMLSPQAMDRTRPAEALVWLAGSTHDGEEAAVLDAYLNAKKNLDHLVLILAPRHPERVPQIEGLLRQRHLNWRLWSEGAGLPMSHGVVLVDTLGELSGLFALADLVFLGGSLVPVGGHNVLEPAAAGVFQIWGPHTGTVDEFVCELVEEGAALQISGPSALSSAVQSLLADGPRRDAGGQAARRVVARHRGALAETMNILGGCRPGRMND